MQNGNFLAHGESNQSRNFLGVAVQNSKVAQHYRLTILLFFRKMYLTSLWCHFPVVTKFTSFILLDDTSSSSFGRFLLFDGESVPHFSLPVYKATTDVTQLVPWVTARVRWFRLNEYCSVNTHTHCERRWAVRTIIAQANETRSWSFCLSFTFTPSCSLCLFLALATHPSIRLAVTASWKVCRRWKSWRFLVAWRQRQRQRRWRQVAVFVLSTYHSIIDVLPQANRWRRFASECKWVVVVLVLTIIYNVTSCSRCFLTLCRALLLFAYHVVSSFKCFNHIFAFTME